MKITLNDILKASPKKILIYIYLCLLFFIFDALYDYFYAIFSIKKNILSIIIIVLSVLLLIYISKVGLYLFEILAFIISAAGIKKDLYNKIMKTSKMLLVLNNVVFISMLAIFLFIK
jgi:hypothetical protein